MSKQKLMKVTCTHYLDPELHAGISSGSFEAPAVIDEQIRKTFGLDRWVSLALASLPASVRKRIKLDGKALP